MWNYYIKEHSLYHEDEFITNGCQSGHPPHVNDPTAVAIKNIGPLPPNEYLAKDAVNHHDLGPVAIELIPIGGGDMHGRGAMWIHGYNAANRLGSSRGCINAPHEIRVRFDSSKDKKVAVHLARPVAKGGKPPDEPVDSKVTKPKPPPDEPVDSLRAARSKPPDEPVDSLGFSVSARPRPNPPDEPVDS